VKNLPVRQLVTIATLIVTLVALIVLKRRCGVAMEGMFKALDPPRPAVSDGGPPRG
jgi:hypothetical protein